jgi:hypothetical protein
VSGRPARKRKVRSLAACENFDDRIDLSSTKQSIDAKLAANLGRAQAVARRRRNDFQVHPRAGGTDGVTNPGQHIPRYPDILESQVANPKRPDHLQKLKRILDCAVVARQHEYKIHDIPP